MQAKE
ncbi:MAG: hypothetical protein EZS28_043327, partial [Streblomastix strix]